MLPANLHLKDFVSSTIQYFTLRSPTNSNFHQLPTDDSDPEEGSKTPSSDRGSLEVEEVDDPIGRLTRECTSLRQQLETARLHCCIGSRRRQSSQLSTISSSNFSPRSSSASSSLLMADAHYREITRLEEKCRRLERALKETKDALRLTEAELNRARRDENGRSASERRRSDVSERSRPSSPFRPSRNSHPMMNLRSLISRSSGDLVHQVPLPADPISEERARQRSREVFFTKTDGGWSGAAVLQAVHDLNAEILQFSATVTEAYTFSSSSTALPVDAAQNTASRLGTHLTQLLSRRDHSQDPVLVQLALQGCATIAISRALTAFCIGLPSKPDTMLNQIHSHMHTAEAQPVASRWRALAHKHIHALHQNLEERGTEEITDTIFRWAADLFVLCGCSTAASGPNGLKARFGAQLKRISWSATRLAKVLRQEIMSTNFELIAIDGGQTFDREQMTDAFGEYVRTSGVVLTTTELGLRCVTHAPEEGMEHRVLLLPKVIVESVVDVLN